MSNRYTVIVLLQQIRTKTLLGLAADGSTREHFFYIMLLFSAGLVHD